VIQNASDSYKGRIISGIEFKGVASPMEAYRYFEEQHIKLMGSKCNSKLIKTARKALLKWLKENGHPNVKVSVSVEPTPTREDKEVVIVFTVEE
jgi:outer membrane protein assembly factor BamA